MKHYIQYHNSERQGGRPEFDGDDFDIFSNKGIRHLLGQQVWLVSGEGTKKKSYYLECTYIVENVEVGEPSIASDSDGTRFDPPILLNGLSWFDAFKKQQQNFSLGVREIDELTIKSLEEIAAQHGDPKLSVFAKLVKLTADEFISGLKVIESKLTAPQKEMLVGHANAIGSTASMGQLADWAGYERFEVANLQYGKIGSLLSDALGISGVVQKTQILATAPEDPMESDHWQWVMRPALVEALRQLWPDVVLRTTESVAAAEIDMDSACSNLKATEKAALIKARIGQGVYRRKLMELWQGRCAVTGCDVEAVLVASHAKPWRSSNNQERLDPHNGLLLAASVDRLFDNGLIAFDDDGRILIGASLTDAQLQSVGLTRASRLSKTEVRHQPYLSAHREQVFNKQ